MMPITITSIDTLLRGVVNTFIPDNPNDPVRVEEVGELPEPGELSPVEKRRDRGQGEDSGEPAQPSTRSPLRRGGHPASGIQLPWKP